MEPMVDAMARELRPWLDTPYVVFGHSMGALLAFEWVRKLQRSGHPMPAWLFLSGHRAPDMPGDTRLLHSLSDREFVAELTRLYRGIPDGLLLEAEFMEVFLPILRADIAVVESYRFQEDEPLDCPITVFAGSQDTNVSWDQLLAWKRQTRRRFAAQIFPGGHFYPHPPLLQAISATLAELHL
jgi:medium-chain acyl-[acyl-carrier-protein] hydrolase